jgi:N12 class adenine-specific DNA methylase
MEELPPCYTEAEKNFTTNKLIPHELQSLPVNAFCKLDGQLYQRGEEYLEPIAWSHQIAKNLTILQTVDELLRRQLSETDEQLVSLRAKLNQEYDRFVEMCGYLSGDENKAKMQSDPRYALLHSLDADGKKAQIFTKRTTRGYIIPDQCATSKEALLHCLKVIGRVDLKWISERVKC